MIFRREKYLGKIYASLAKEKLVLLLWTRQVGKTTLLQILQKELTGNIYYYSFEDDFSKIEFTTKADFMNYFTLSLGVDFGSAGTFLIDEFQYVKDGEKILKSLYDDQNIRLKFVVTGSGLWTYGTDNKGTLVGRGDEIFIYSFDFFEFLEAKWLRMQGLTWDAISESISTLITPYFHEYLTFGGYPSVIFSETRTEKIAELEKIINRYIERDISFFLDKNRLIDFKKFFVYLHSQIGNLLKKEAIGEYLGIKTRHIEDFLFILEKTLFIARVYPFFSDKSKEYSALPKFYFSDVGVLNFIEKSFDYRENNGKIIENFVFNELEKNKKFGSDSIKIYKKLSKSEIDFIYDGLDMCIPIEVKSGNKDTIPKIFYSFEEEYNQKTTAYILTNGTSSERKTIGSKELAIIPNWYIGKFLTEKQKVQDS